MAVMYKEIVIEGITYLYASSTLCNDFILFVDDINGERVGGMTINHSDEVATVQYYNIESNDVNDSDELSIGLNYYEFNKKSPEDIIRWIVSTHPNNG